MKLLLDTHAIIWLREGSSRLGRRVRDMVRQAQADELGIADIVLLEASMLVSRGRIMINGDRTSFLHALASRLTVLPITPEITASATDLLLPHADPFDRLIVATAIHHSLPLATRDREIAAANLVPVVWD